jgi:hypothetical protein
LLLLLALTSTFVIVDIVVDNIIATVIFDVVIVDDNPVDDGLDPLSLTPSFTAAFLQYFETIPQTAPPDGEDACNDS